MMDKGRDELQDVLKEGISALKDMRRGIENACAKLRTHYIHVASEDARVASDRGSKGKRCGKDGIRVCYESYRTGN